MPKKIFILGIGAQKSGSTWLHSCFKYTNTINTGWRKEYHVFDALFSPHCKHFKDKLEKKFIIKIVAI